MEVQQLKRKIYEIRGQKIMFDFDLAALYETDTRSLKQAVKRNLSRFPDDFMFQLNEKEWIEVITNCDNLLDTKIKFSPSRPYAFTEQGVAMLSSILRNQKAIEVNIAIMRTFVHIRQYALSHEHLSQKLAELEKKFDRQFNDINEAILYLMQSIPEKTVPNNPAQIGYKIN